MSQGFQDRSNRRSGSALGATAVLFLGSVGAGILAGVLGNDPNYSMLVLVLGGSGILLLLWLAFRNPAGSMLDSFAWMVSRQREDDVTYLPRRRQRGMPPPISLTPPTAEEVRELKESGSTWVPGRNSRKAELPPPAQAPPARQTPPR